MSRSIQDNYEVAIIGAGPVGVTVANLLGGYGVNALLIDREADIIDIPRAVALCEEGSRVLAAAGILDLVEKDLCNIKRVVLANKRKEPAVHAKVDKVNNGHLIVRTFHQPEIEQKMRLALRRFNSIDFCTSTELCEFADNGDWVSLTLTHQGQRVETKARFMLACDGAKSFVRKTLGIGFGGETYPQDWLIVDVENAPVISDEVVFTINPERPSVTMPGPGSKRRWEFVIKHNDDVGTLLSEERIYQLLSPWGDSKQMQVVRKAIYTFHARSAEKYREGRIFLLGDAAHVTPPFAGQGMMAGIRDTYNIAWKLTAVLKGQLPDTILDSYEKERIPQNKQVIRFAQQMGYFILPQKRLRVKMRDFVIAIVKMTPIYSKTEGLPIEKIPNHINGSLLRNFFKSRFAKTGFEFPQYDLAGPNGRFALSDHFIDGRFHILGWETNPTEFLDEMSRNRWDWVDGEVKIIGKRPLNNNSKNSLLDQAGNYAKLFAKGKRVVVIRPDKMMVINCKPHQLNQKLNHYLDSLGVPENVPTQKINQ